MKTRTGLATISQRPAGAATPSAGEEGKGACAGEDRHRPGLAEEEGMSHLQDKWTSIKCWVSRTVFSRPVREAVLQFVVKTCHIKRKLRG